MRRLLGVCVLVITAALLTVLSGCQKPEGPAEKAGKELDKAAEQAGQQIQKAADAVRDAARGDGK